MKAVNFNKNKSIVLQIWEKVILVVAMATEVAIKIFKIIFLVLSDNDHSVKVSSNSEMCPGQLYFGPLRELVLNFKYIIMLNWRLYVQYIDVPYTNSYISPLGKIRNMG